MTKHLSVEGVAPTLNRRKVIEGGTLAFVGLAALPHGALAQTATPAAPSGQPDVSPVDGLDSFMKVSELVTERTGLNHDIGARILGAFSGASDSAVNGLEALAQSLASKNLSPAQTKQAVAIQQAWYLGMVARIVITYEQALAFEAVKEYLKPRSYVGGAPGFWAADPNKPGDNLGAAKYLGQAK